MTAPARLIDDGYTCPHCERWFANEHFFTAHCAKCAEGIPPVPVMPNQAPPERCPRCGGRWFNQWGEAVCLMCGPWTGRRAAEDWARTEKAPRSGGKANRAPKIAGGKASR